MMAIVLRNARINISNGKLIYDKKEIYINKSIGLSIVERFNSKGEIEIKGALAIGTSIDDKVIDLDLNDHVTFVDSDV